MQDQIIIRMPTSGDDIFSWIKLSSTIVSPIVERGSLDALVATVAGFKVVVLVPGSDVTLQNISVPTQNKQRMLKAIPYANEDEIASDVESLHFSLGKITEKDNAPVAIVDVTLMDQWQTLFQSAGLSVDVLMPETMAVPFSADKTQLNILVEDNDALFRASDYEGFYVDLDNLNVMLKLWLNERADNLPQSIIVWGGDEVSQLMLDAPEEVELEYKPAPKGLLGLLTTQPIDFEASINLLQGDYSRREQIGRIWRPWRLAASLAGALFVLQLVTSFTQSSSLETQYLALKAESKKIYKDTFPDARRIVNPRRQMEDELKKIKGGGGKSSVTFLSLLADTSSIFKATAGLNLKSIRFKNSTLDVELEVPNYQVLDQLKQKLTKEGVRSVEIQSAVTRNDIVQGRLQIKGLAS